MGFLVQFNESTFDPNVCANMTKEQIDSLKNFQFWMEGVLLSGIAIMGILFNICFSLVLGKSMFFVFFFRLCFFLMEIIVVLARPLLRANRESIHIVTKYTSKQLTVVTTYINSIYRPQLGQKTVWKETIKQKIPRYWNNKKISRGHKSIFVAKVRN